MSRSPSIFISTLGGIGYLPIAPGTWASLCAMLFYVFVLRHNLFGHCLSIISLSIIGVYTAGRTEDSLHITDPRCVVIDEFVGMLLSYLLVPYKWGYIISGFILFRVFDILKPYPINRIEDTCLRADTHRQRCKRGWAIVGDDLVAAIYTNLSLQVAYLVSVFAIHYAPSTIH